MNRTWALSEKGKELVALLKEAGLTDEEFAVRVAEHMVPVDELYAPLDEEPPRG